NCASAELLAGPGLALEQDRDLAVGRALEDREQLAHREALADELAETATLAGWPREAVGLGLGPQVAVAEAQRRPGADGRRVDRRALEQGPVLRAEIADLEPAPELAPALGRNDLEVASRDPGIGEDQIAAWIAADGQRRPAKRRR